MRAVLVLSSVILLGACGESSDERPDAGPANLPDAALDAGAERDASSSTDAGDEGLARDAGLDAGERDASSSTDAGDEGLARDAGLDAGERDAGALDSGAFDADGGGTPAPGFGDITGSCGVLDDELTSPAPGWFQNSIDFGTDPYDDADYARLGEGGREIIDDGNAGGSSLLSEVFSFELLARCEGATLLKTETEVSYLDRAGKITDLLVEIDGRKVGVSVTRAVAFPFEAPYSVEQAQELLEKKLAGVRDSSANVAPEDAWVKQILYVIAFADGHAEALASAFDRIDDALKADTLVMVSVSDGDDDFLY